MVKPSGLLLAVNAPDIAWRFPVSNYAAAKEPGIVRVGFHADFPRGIVVRTSGVAIVSRNVGADLLALTNQRLKLN